MRIGKYTITAILICISLYSAAQKNETVAQIDFQEFKDSIKLQQSFFRQQIDSLENENNELKTLLIGEADTAQAAIDSVNSRIDARRLESMLNISESTLKNQNYWIEVFGVIYAIIAIGIAVITGIIYFFNVWPLIKQAQRSVDRAETATNTLNSRIDDFDNNVKQKLDDRFLEFEKKLEKERLDEMFKDIRSNLPHQKRIQIEKLSQYGGNNLDLNRISELIEILNTDNFEEEHKTTIVEVLIENNSTVVKDFFKSWTNVKADNDELKETLYRYYLENGIEDYFPPITSFILSYASQYLEFQKVLLSLPSHPKEFYKILNYGQLIKAMDQDSIVQVRKFLNENIDGWSLLNREQIESSVLYKVPPIIEDENA